MQLLGALESPKGPRQTLPRQAWSVAQRAASPATATVCRKSWGAVAFAYVISTCTGTGRCHCLLLATPHWLKYRYECGQHRHRHKRCPKNGCRIGPRSCVYLHTPGRNEAP